MRCNSMSAYIYYKSHRLDKYSARQTPTQQNVQIQIFMMLDVMQRRTHWIAPGHIYTLITVAVMNRQLLCERKGEDLIDFHRY